MSQDVRLRHLAGAIVRKIRQHFSSARELYMAVRHSSSDGGSVSLASVRSGLRRIGLSVSLDDLVVLTTPFSKSYPGLALTLPELQHFIDTVSSQHYAEEGEAASADVVADAGVDGAGASRSRGGGGGGGGARALNELLEHFHATPENLQLALERYDMDYDGYLSVDEFRRALALKGYRISKQQCQAIIGRFASRVPDKLPIADLVYVLQRSDAVTPGGAGATSDRVAEAAAASAARRSSMGRSGRGSGAGRPAPVVRAPPPPRSSGSRPGSASAAPLSESSLDALVRSVADAVYSDSSSVHTLFKRMASAHDGVDASDLVHGLKRMRCTVSPREALALVKEFDLDGDGRLSYAEFVKMLAASS